MFETVIATGLGFVTLYISLIRIIVGLLFFLFFFCPTQELIRGGHTFTFRALQCLQPFLDFVCDLLDVARLISPVYS